MKSQDFFDQISRLKTIYQSTAFSDEICAALYVELGHFEYEHFKMAITRVIATKTDTRYAPNVEDIEKAISYTREKFLEQRKEKERKDLNAAANVIEITKRSKTAGGMRFILRNEAND